MPRHKYVCEACGNEIEAVKVDKRASGTKGMVTVRTSPRCECPAGSEMVREPFTPQRRDASRHTGRF